MNKLIRCINVVFPTPAIPITKTTTGDVRVCAGTGCGNDEVEEDDDDDDDDGAAEEGPASLPSAAAAPADAEDDADEDEDEGAAAAAVAAGASTLIRATPSASTCALPPSDRLNLVPSADTVNSI